VKPRLASALPVLEAAASYVRRHPEEVLRVVRNAIGLRFGVPIVALRFLISNLDGKRAPKDVEIAAVPPGVRFAATLDLMGTTVRASAVVIVEALKLDAETLRVELRLREVGLKALDDRQETPIAALLKSGALDLSKPGNLVAFIPKRPPMIVDAKDDRIVIDAMKIPKLAANAKIKRALGVTTPVLTVKAIKSKDDHLDVHLGASIGGIPDAVAAARN
jgi:hypothetical protein